MINYKEVRACNIVTTLFFIFIFFIILFTFIFYIHSYFISYSTHISLLAANTFELKSFFYIYTRFGCD